MYKLLVVDDNNRQVNGILKFVNWEDFDVTQIKVASNGTEGLEIFKEFQPDIVFTDVVMPVMDGIAMTHKIREIDNKVKIIIISCYEKFDYVKVAIDHGITSYLLKPFTPAQLLEVVEKTMKQIHDEEQYARQNRLYNESLPSLRTGFLYRLLYAKHIHKDYLDKVYHDLQYDDYNNFIFAKFFIVTDDPNILDIHALLKLTKQTFSNEIEFDFITEDTDKLLMLIKTVDKNENMFFENTVCSLNNYIKLVDEKLNIKISVGISNVCNTLERSAMMLNQATSALENGFHPSVRDVYFYEEYKDELEYNVSDLKEDMKIVLEEATDEKIDWFLDRYYHKQHISKNTAKSLCISIITTLQLLLLERNIEIKELFGNSEIIWNHLDKFESIYNVRQWLWNMIKASLELINDREMNSQNKLIDQIVRIIDSNYSDITSVDQIASEIFVSTGYAQRVFKKYMGLSISEYLTNKRIEQAKKMLVTGSKVYEAGQAVGYKNKTYFIEIFKRYTKVTPKEFQQQK